jgi:shikimate kinase
MGFMGSGKTTVGKELAGELDRNFMDIDEKIELDVGLTIPQIFAQNGEAFFRSKEKEWVNLSSIENNLVVALGGGSVIDPENWERITQSGITVALHCPIEVIQSRLREITNRPLLAGTEEEKMQRIKQLYEQRKKFYARAQYQLQLSGDESVSEIVEKLTKLIWG